MTGGTPSDVVFGFDPGGDGNFGWAVCGFSHALPLSVIDAGTAHSARSAANSALTRIPPGGRVHGIGVDSPLFWPRHSSRTVEPRLRHILRRLGHPHPEGTVQHINSLAGACLVEGVIVVHEVRENMPGILVSECHPKVLLWLLGIATPARPAAMIPAGEIEQLANTSLLRSEHLRDAALAALSAWAAVTQPPNWTNLFTESPDNLLPAGHVSYYMPLPGPDGD